MNSDRVVRIGGASGFWGDSAVGAPQLVASGQIDYLVFDYLAELTMSILAGAKQKNPELGYATDFVSIAMRSVLQEIVTKGIKVVSNAGGVNPLACAKALSALALELGVTVKIAVVTGDDVMYLSAELQQSMAFPAKTLSANAYLGALPIQAALGAGADVVITGRCVDSAVTLGVLMHEFDWSADDYDKLAGGSLAGHIIECGAQGTGGLHTDWREVPDWAHIGYPIVECAFDGSFVATKPASTGGLVNCAVIAEQMLYEIGDPSAYILPDVICDFTEVKLEQIGQHRVQVTGAKGRAPTTTYKVSATYMDGYKLSAQLIITGLEAAAKAQRSGEAIFKRTSEMLAAQSLAPYLDTNIEVLGGSAENSTGSIAVLRVTATHASKAALELMAREIVPAGTSWAPGTTGGGAGRAAPAPCIKQFAFLLDKARVRPVVTLGSERFEIAIPKPVRTELVEVPSSFMCRQAQHERSVVKPKHDWIGVPLIQLAWGRSGDKGDISNIGIIARKPEYLAILRAQLTEDAIAKWLKHFVSGRVTRYEVPGIHAFNFVCEQALGGGGMSSLRYDPLGKGMAQLVLAMPLKVPKNLVASSGA